MSSDQTTTPIPVSAGQRIAEEFGYDQVVIVARKVGVREHVTTYGVDKAHCAVAARMGNFFKHKLMGWPAEPAADCSAQVAGVMKLVLEHGNNCFDCGEFDLDNPPDNDAARVEFEAKVVNGRRLKSAIEAAVRKLAGEAP